MKMRIRAVFTGRVQGVFFRDWTQRKANEHGITGWVHNVEDGSVEAVFEGDETAIKRVIHWLKNDHPTASVTGINTEVGPYTGEFEIFEIRY